MGLKLTGTHDALDFHAVLTVVQRLHTQTMDACPLLREFLNAV